MIPLSALLVAQALEEAMPLKPRIRVKAQGRAVFLGKDFEAAANAAGKETIKQKRKRRPLPQEIASRKKRRYKPAK